MNFRNKWLVGTLRTILGLFIIFSGVSGFMSIGHPEYIPEAMRPAMQIFVDAGIFQFIKITEIIAGLLLLCNFLPWLGAMALVPVMIGAIVFNSNVSPANVAFSAVFALLVAYFGFVYWDKYKPLFVK